METEEGINTESATGDDNKANAMTDAERAKKEKEKEKQRKKKEAKKEKEKEAKETKKDKDKDKDKGGKEAEKKKKTPGDFIKEQLRKRQEEEDRLRREQEEEERRLAELERQRLEKIRLEKERKEREKQKKKEKIAQLKKEGKYLTPEQKQKLQRQREMVELLKQQGAVIVGGADKDAALKKPKYGDKKKPAKGDQAGTESAVISHEPSPEEAEQEKGTGEDLAESWDQLDISREQDSSSEEESEDGKTTTDEDEPEEEKGVNEVISVEKPAAPVSQIKESPSFQSQSSVQIIQHETKEEMRERIINQMKKRRENALARKSTDVLRSPVICVLGHVDTGKTKILDNIRRTHVQDSEAGGITQQIGATMVPSDSIKERAKMVKGFEGDLLRLPGFLIIDTPGHESFSNLRSRGSSLCDIAVLVVDIMHALEPQTIESLDLLKKRNTPFVVALNKVDRLYEWKQNPHKDIRNVLKLQLPNCQAEFNERVNEVKLKFAEQGINAVLFWENRDPSEYVSLVPTSARTGDGMGNLIACLAEYTQTILKEKVAFCEELRCTILEVKMLPGLGTTIDVILVDGTLHVGDTIIAPGTEGPIVTQIRELLMPEPLRELRVKNPYQHFKEIKGAQGIKILAKDLEKTLAGLPLMVAYHEEEIDIIKEEVASSLKAALKAFTLAERGVYVQASTLGALEALLTFLRDQKIPYCGINIGPVHKRDVVKASTMLEHDSQWAVILAFDVKIERDAQQMADELGVRIFSADIIYHLQDAYIKFREEWKEKKRQENAHLAIYPVKLRVLPAHIYNSRDPLVMGVMIEDGVAKIGTPICVPSKEGIILGTVASIEANHKQIDTARKGQEVCIKIENTTGEAPKMYGRHFDHQDVLVSKISRESIDVMKTYFRDDLQKSDWQLIVELKKLLGVL